jgi:hypothetical protein
MDVEMPASFHFLTEFSDQLALEILNSSDSCYGFINRAGVIEIKPNHLLQVKYAFGDDKDIGFTPRFHNDFCSIPVKNGFTLIDKQGNQVSNIYDSILTVNTKKHIFACKFKNHWGAIRYNNSLHYFVEFIGLKYSNKQEVYNQYQLLVQQDRIN